MNAFDATVELTKAVIASTTGAHTLLTSDNLRGQLLTGIEALYKKMQELEKAESNDGE